MKIRFIGDVHGYKNELKLILDNLPSDIDSVIQVGDMGVGYGQGGYWHNSLEEMLLKVNGRFIRGNHDNPSKCKEMKTWIKDGTYENGIMFIGGAWSIDYTFLERGVSWWPDEELSYEEFYQLIGLYDYLRPRIMVTHDCPHSVSKRLFIDTGKSFSSGQYITRTGTALQEMFEAHKPDLWIFGHWHNNVDEVIDRTRFICIDEMSYVDIDTKTFEVKW